MAIDDDVIRKAPLFHGVAAGDAEALAAKLHPVTLKRGQALFHQGEPGDRLYIVGKGKVKLARRTADGREILLALAGPGEMLGELTMFDPGPRAATATAVSTCEAYELSHRDLMAWIEAHPPVATQLLAALAARVRRADDAMGDMVFADVPSRVAKALLDFGRRFGEPSAAGTRVPHDLTQEELAQLVGASRESVNKALSDFTGRGWIERDGRVITLRDIPRLERRAR